jgi:hypothetical protein
MVSMWTLAPQALDDLLSRGDIAAASELYDPHASLVADEAPSLHGRLAIRDALQAFQDTIAIRYYVRRLRVAERSQMLPAGPSGEPRTHSALGWCVRGASGMDEVIEQHFERTWTSHWHVVTEHRTTSRERLPYKRRRPVIRTPELVVWFAEVLEYARDFLEYSLDTPCGFRVDQLPGEVLQHTRRVAATYPLVVLAVLLRHSAQHDVMGMSRWRLSWVIRRAAEQALTRQTLGLLSGDADARREVLRHIRGGLSALEHAGVARTRHDLVLPWLEDRFVAEISAGEATDELMCGIARSLVDPVYQTWLAHLEKMSGFRWKGEATTTA